MHDYSRDSIASLSVHPVLSAVQGMMLFSTEKGGSQPPTASGCPSHALCSFSRCQSLLASLQSRYPYSDLFQMLSNLRCPAQHEKYFPKACRRLESGCFQACQPIPNTGLEICRSFIIFVWTWDTPLPAERELLPVNPWKQCSLSPAVEGWMPLRAIVHHLLGDVSPGGWGEFTRGIWARLLDEAG